MGHVLSFSSHLFQDGIVVWTAARLASAQVRAAKGCMTGRKVFCWRKGDDEAQVGFNVIGYRLGSEHRSSRDCL